MQEHVMFTSKIERVCLFQHYSMRQTIKACSASWSVLIAMCSPAAQPEIVLTCQTKPHVAVILVFVFCMVSFGGVCGACACFT